MIFKYKVISQDGVQSEGTVEAATRDNAIASLQRRNLTVITITDTTSQGVDLFNFFNKVGEKDVVIFSRQVATLFDAGVSALKAFRILAIEAENKTLAKHLSEVADDIQAGMSISNALAKHNEIFSPFYVNMVRSGEETGKLNNTFLYLADYMDRNFELSSKTKNALIYPSFVIGTFFVVMILMLTMVIPKLASIIKESGQVLPLYTRAVLGLSDLVVNYGFFLALVLAAIGLYFYFFLKKESNKEYFDRVRLSIPYVGSLYRKLYYSRISDNLDTMLSSGISIVRAIEITARVVDNHIYERILEQIATSVKGGVLLSDAMREHPEMPNIMIQMVKIGEETGEVASILRNLAKFYKREVDNAVDTLVSLIEPVMIVALGLGVGILLASVLLPIYNIAGAVG